MEHLLKELLLLTFVSHIAAAAQGLECFHDKISARAVVVGCPEGLACGTTTLHYNGSTEVVRQCATASECTSGRGILCSRFMERTQNCSTECCFSDRCNQVQSIEYDITGEVPREESITCYVTVINEEMPEQCMFKNATCSYLTEGSFSKISQMCTSKEACHIGRRRCEFRMKANALLLKLGARPIYKECEVKCCDYDRCNALPFYVRYNKVPGFENKRFTTTTTTTTTTTATTTTSPPTTTRERRRRTTTTTSGKGHDGKGEASRSGLNTALIVLVFFAVSTVC